MVKLSNEVEFDARRYTMSSLRDGKRAEQRGKEGSGKGGNDQVDRGSDVRRSEQDSEVIGRMSSDMEK